VKCATGSVSRSWLKSKRGGTVPGTPDSIPPTLGIFQGGHSPLQWELPLPASRQATQDPVRSDATFASSECPDPFAEKIHSGGT
jgi:hypothetical protein